MTAIIDTHCHYNMKPISDAVSEHWKKAQENGIEKTITVGADLETSKKALEISKEYPNMFASIGLHPEVCTEEIKNLLDGDKYSQEKIDQFIDESLDSFSVILDNELETENPDEKKLVAIGEAGLDYYRLKNKGLKRDLVVGMQRKLFQKQLELAFNNNLVAIIHVRDQSDRQENNAYFDVLNILKAVISETKSPDKIKFVLHCVSGPQTYIKEALSLGAYIGIAGNITYDSAQDLREIIKIVPEDRLLLETDAPYLIPKSQQKTNKDQTQFCEPFMIKATANYLQQEMGLNLDIIRHNSLKLFSI